MKIPIYDVNKMKTVYDCDDEEKSFSFNIKIRTTTGGRGLAAVSSDATDVLAGCWCVLRGARSSALQRRALGALCGSHIPLNIALSHTLTYLSHSGWGTKCAAPHHSSTAPTHPQTHEAQLLAAGRG